MSPPIQYRGTSTVRCEGKMTRNKNKRLVAKEQQVIASDSSLPCKVFFFRRGRKEKSNEGRSKRKTTRTMERKMGPSVRRKGKMKIFPLSLCPKACFSSLRKWEKKEQRKLPEKKIERRRRKEMSVCTPEKRETKVFLCPYKLPILSFLTSFLFSFIAVETNQRRRRGRGKRKKKEGNKQ